MRLPLRVRLLSGTIIDFVLNTFGFARNVGVMDLMVMHVLLKKVVEVMDSDLIEEICRLRFLGTTSVRCPKFVLQRRLKL